ncbi:MAG TPA: DUF1573 domain-containing protein [Candidatus Binatia bacterium]|nr:DUF1573 domain-containing protein [Candidatus Binatia bacterium]
MIPATVRNAARAVFLGFLLSCLGCDAPASGPVAVAQSAPQNPESAVSAAPATGAPHIVFAEPVHDFGKVEQGEQVTHMFRFTNQGGQELRIESVKTSCGCTAAVISEEVIPPGKEGTISATFDTTHFSGEKAKGISVYSNDPLQPVTTLTLQGEITVEVAADPAQLYLGRLRRGEEITRSTDVLYDAQKPIAIVKIENSHPSLSVQAEDFSKEGKKGKKLIVMLKKDAPLGRFNDQIVVTTTSQKKPVLEIPVFGSVEGDMLVLPPQVSFGVVRRGESKTQEISIKNRGTKPVQVVRLQNSAPEVVAELTPVKQGEEYRLTLRTKGESKPGRIQGEIQVFTDHPEEKVLTIPLYGIVAEAEQAKQ